MEPLFAGHIIGVIQAIRYRKSRNPSGSVRIHVPLILIGLVVLPDGSRTVFAGTYEEIAVMTGAFGQARGYFMAGVASCAHVGNKGEMNPKMFRPTHAAGHRLSQRHRPYSLLVIVCFIQLRGILGLCFTIYCWSPHYTLYCCRNLLAAATRPTSFRIQQNLSSVIR